MTDISRLLFQREHFPVEIVEAKTRDGKKFYDFERIWLPPYHPSMREEGIDVELAVSVLGEALEDTVKDLEAVKGKIVGIQFELESFERDPQTQK
ncbi:hypothetical protein J4448_02820 [Candidatus Woesearchaeota archaeon]|nr:hypothetical protein [Candidatus Woesearchaeota archaeon]